MRTKCGTILNVNDPRFHCHLPYLDTELRRKSKKEVERGHALLEVSIVGNDGAPLAWVPLFFASTGIPMLTWLGLAWLSSPSVHVICDQPSINHPKPPGQSNHH